NPEMIRPPDLPGADGRKRSGSRVDGWNPLSARPARRPSRGGTGGGVTARATRKERNQGYEQESETQQTLHEGLLNKATPRRRQRRSPPGVGSTNQSGPDDGRVVHLTVRGTYRRTERAGGGGLADAAHRAVAVGEVDDTRVAAGPRPPPRRPEAV